MKRRAKSSLLSCCPYRWFRRLWADDHGAEIAEWVVVVAFVLTTGLIIYNYILSDQLNNAADTIGNRIQNAAAGGSGGN